MAIRYDEKINNKIRRIVNNYNAKIKRLEGKKDEKDPQQNKILYHTLSDIHLWYCRFYLKIPRECR